MKVLDMKSETIISRLHQLLSEIPQLRNLHPKSNEDVFSRWKESVAFFILTALDNNENHPI